MNDLRSPRQSEEFGFLDLAAIASNWWKLLVLISLFAGIGTFGLLRFAPVSYSAQVLLDAKPEQIIQISQPAVIDPVLRARYSDAQDDETLAQRRRALLGSLKIFPAPQTSYFYVTLDGGKTPADVVDTLTAIVNQFLRNTAPSGAPRKALESDIQFLEDRMKELLGGLQRYNDGASKASNALAAPPASLAGPPPQIAYLNEINATRDALAQKKNKLIGLDWETHVPQKPALLIRDPMMKLPLVIAAMVVAFLLTFFVGLLAEILKRMKQGRGTNQRIADANGAFRQQKSSASPDNGPTSMAHRQ